MGPIASATYGLGWISLVLAVVYRILLFTAAGRAMVARTGGLVPRSLLGFSALLFLVSIASDLRARGSKA
jgi:hypothetical protein